MAKALFAASLLVLGASAAGAQLRPSSTPEIVAAVKDCAAATGTKGIEEKTLLSAGWTRAIMQQDGKPVESELHFFGKAGANPLITTHMPKGEPGTICSVMARTTAFRDYQQLIDALDALEDTNAVQRTGNTIVFMDKSHMMQTQPTGSREQPAVRISIASLGAAAKK